NSVVYRENGQTTCASSGDTEWRIRPTGVSGENSYYIAVESNQSSQSGQQLAVTTTSTAAAVATASTAAGQRWLIVATQGGYFQLRSGGLSGYCLSVGGPTGNGLGTFLVPVTCDAASSAQWFRFDLLGNPLPPTDVYPNGIPVTCTFGDSETQLTW